MIQTQQLTTVNGFKFSGVNVASLTSSKYCLVSLLVDCSGSVTGFKAALENAANIVVQATKKSPEAENIILRTATFANQSITEVHGFTPVMNIPDDRYSNKFHPGGSTPLIDASVEAAESIESYGRQLVDQDYMVNGIFFVITDGEECSSRLGNNPVKVKEAIQRIRTNEAVESIVAILVGVNDRSCKAYLDKFHMEAGFDHYISIGNATPDKLAKLGALISQSVSSQSQSIGSGGPSKACNFVI
jgi:uncharacterized protein YegL